jgi:hypothetical protein
MGKLWSNAMIRTIGLAALTVGAVTVIANKSGAGLVALIATGAIFLLSPFIVSRLEHVSVSTSGLELALTQEMSDLGAPKAAHILDRSDLATFAESYAFIHEELRDPQYLPARAHLEDLLIERAGAVARREKFEASEVRTLFANASPMMRTLILGIMEGDLSVADGPTIMSAISEPRTANEQYHGLKLAEICWPRLSTANKHAIQSLVRDQSFPPDSDRIPLAERVLSLPTS